MPSIQITDTTELVFDDGKVVRAASAIARLGQGWLVAQDDATIAAWWRGDSITGVRVFPAVDGHDSFREADGTKHLKPDLESACPVAAAGEQAVLLLGSGSLPARMRAALVWPGGNGDCAVETAELDELYARLATALEIDQDHMNMEGACVVGDRLRWFQRGNGAKGVASAAVDVDLEALLAAIQGRGAVPDVGLGAVERYDLGDANGVPLAITDAVVLPDGRILVSAAAEDAPDAVADGPIVAAALGVLDGAEVVTVLELPTAADGSAWKVEGVAVQDQRGDRLEVLAVVDQDDPDRPALALTLDVRLD